MGVAPRVLTYMSADYYLAHKQQLTRILRPEQPQQEEDEGYHKKEIADPVELDAPPY